MDKVMQNFSDLVEENGKTIKENNIQRQHRIPLGALVEVEAAERNNE